MADIGEDGCAANISPDGYANIGPLEVGVTGIGIHEPDRRSASRRRSVTGSWLPTDDSGERGIVTDTGGPYRERDTKLLALAAQALGLTVVHRPPGHRRGRPAHNRVSYDERRYMLRRVPERIDHWRGRKVYDPTGRSHLVGEREARTRARNDVAVELKRSYRTVADIVRRAERPQVPNEGPTRTPKPHDPPTSDAAVEACGCQRISSSSRTFAPWAASSAVN